MRACSIWSLFPTCQVRVVRFYVSWLPPSAFRLPSASSCSSSSSAGPQPRVSTPSVPCRTSTASIHAKCSLPDLHREYARQVFRENPRPVFPAGPQPRESTPSVPCREHWAWILAEYLACILAVEVRQGTLGVDSRGWGPAGNTWRGFSRLRSGTEHWAWILAVEVRQGTPPERMPKDMPDRMPDRTSDRVPDRNVMMGITRSKVFFFNGTNFVNLPNDLTFHDLLIFVPACFIDSPSFHRTELHACPFLTYYVDLHGRWQACPSIIFSDFKGFHHECWKLKEGTKAVHVKESKQHFEPTQNINFRTKSDLFSINAAKF